jgi:hypothetical protein
MSTLRKTWPGLLQPLSYEYSSQRKVGLASHLRLFGLVEASYLSQIHRLPQNSQSRHPPSPFKRIPYLEIDKNDSSSDTIKDFLDSWEWCPH